jgi:hypothetical protein
MTVAVMGVGRSWAVALATNPERSRTLAKRRILIDPPGVLNGSTSTLVPGANVAPGSTCPLR